jgi:hypothetical protein
MEVTLSSFQQDKMVIVSSKLNDSNEKKDPQLNDSNENRDPQLNDSNENKDPQNRKSSGVTGEFFISRSDKIVQE